MVGSAADEEIKHVCNQARAESILVAECREAANNDNNMADVHVSDIKFCVMRFRLDLTTCSNSSSSIVPEELSNGAHTTRNTACTK